MKKLMVAVAAVALALGAQASSAKWMVNYAGTDFTGTSASAMIFDQSARTQVLAIFSDFGAEGKTLADLQALAIESAAGTPGVGTPQAFARNATAFTQVNAINVSSAGSVFAVLFEDSIGVGTRYQIADDKSLVGFTVEPPAPTTKVLTFAATDFTGSGTIASNVPEPTSAMLLVLGLAGLALKRKRA